MKPDLLNRANNLKIEIESTQKMILALEAPYVNCLRANQYTDCRDTTEVYLFETNDDLHIVILNHFKCKLAKLQKEFDEL
jgi:hypothetical protein